MRDGLWARARTSDRSINRVDPAQGQQYRLYHKDNSVTQAQNSVELLVNTDVYAVDSDDEDDE